MNEFRKWLDGEIKELARYKDNNMMWAKYSEAVHIREMFNRMVNKKKKEKKMLEAALQKVKVKLDEGAYMPERAHDSDAGYDLRTPQDLCVPARKADLGSNAITEGSATVDTGVHIAIPRGYVGFLKSKSGLNVKHDLTGTGVIDSGYTGSIKVKLYNHGNRVHHFAKGDKIIQLVLLPIYAPELEEVDELEDTERGKSGFGSTGK